MDETNDSLNPGLDTDVRATLESPEVNLDVINESLQSIVENAGLDSSMPDINPVADEIGRAHV